MGKVSIVGLSARRFTPFPPSHRALACPGACLLALKLAGFDQDWPSDPPFRTPNLWASKHGVVCHSSSFLGVPPKMPKPRKCVFFGEVVRRPPKHEALRIRGRAVGLGPVAGLAPRVPLGDVARKPHLAGGGVDATSQRHCLARPFPLLTPGVPGL